MVRPRIIPCLLLRNGGLVKTVKFKNSKYIGDPINAVRIFNEKEVDEIIVLDIGATLLGTGPNLDLLGDIASEAFMPFGCGGGITDIDQVKQLYALGVEKVVLNSALGSNPGLVSDTADIAGSSGVVVSIDVRRNWRGRYSVFVRSGQKDLKRDPVEYACEMEKQGAGEIMLNDISRDGTMTGYDLKLIQLVSDAVSIPVVAAGGAGELSHFREAVDHGASAAAAGSMFVYHGKHRAVLITYPNYFELERLLLE